MSDDWKNDRAEGSIHEYEAKKMAESAVEFKKKAKEAHEKGWLEIYAKCKNCTDSPSATRGVIQWFIDNNYEIPKVKEDGKQE